MLKSDDNGATWFQLYLPFIGPATTSFLDASRGYVMGNGYVLYTANGGKSWDIRLQSVSYDGLHHPWFFDENVGFAFEGSTSLKKTINGGRDWEYVTVTSPQWDRWIDIWFLNDKDGFLTNINKTYRTKDGGKTWTVIPDVAGELLRIEFSDQKNGYVFGGNYGSLLYVTTDGGNSWEWKMNYLANGRMTGIARSAAGKLISVHQSYSNSLGRSINFSVDNGNTSAALDDLPDEDFAAIDFITEDVGFLRSQTAQFKTVDKGMTWKRFSWSRPIYYWHFFDENNALLSDGFIIYKTSDGGATMEEVLVTTATDNPYVPAGKLYAVTDDVIFAYSDYGLYRSLDAGEHWQLMSQYGYGSVRDMQFLSATVGYRMSLFGSIEKTTDGGTTWELIYESHPLSSDAFHSVSFVDQNIGYKGGEKFSKTIDGGITWTTMYTNFSSDIFDVHFTDALHGYAAVRHRNLYETFDGGLTWNDILNSSEYEGLYGIQYKHDNIYMIGPEGYLAQIKHPRMKPVQAGYAVGPQVVCVGDTHPYLLSENYSGIYQWNVSGAAVNDEGSRAYIHFPHAGEYTFTINNSNGCGLSEPRLQTVIAVELPAPILTGTELIESLTPVTYQVSNWDDELHYFWTVTGAKSFTNEDVPNSTVTWKLGSTEDTHVQVFAADPKSGCSNSGSLDVTIELALGIEDEGNDFITVYPNPTPAEVTIKSRVNEPLLITLYNTTGIEYFTNELAPSVEAKIQLQHLPAGLYYLEITNSKGNKMTKKILKQ